MTVRRIDGHDVRYPDLVQGNNLRWVGTPDQVYLPRDADEVARCVRELTDEGRRFTVRSGGHCYEDHVFNSSVRAVIELGLLSRRSGLTVDHLHGVEVVTADGEVRLVTRDSTGVDGDLWWAHTGGGGGNFGIVTRHLLRSPDTTDSTPAADLLPRAPRQVLLHDITIPWDQVGPAQLAVMLRRFSDWCAHHSSPDAEAANRLFALFRVFPG